jgi:hypothetical protein
MKKRIVWICFVVFTATIALQLAAQPTPVDPVNWRKLTPFLQKVEGWETKGEINGSTINTGGFKMSIVKGNFVKNGQRLQIQITDGGYVPMAYAAFKAMAQFEIDTSDEYVKKTTIQGFTAIESIRFKSMKASIMILVVDRFMVQLEARNMKEIKVLKAVAKLLNLKALAALAK